MNAPYNPNSHRPGEDWLDQLLREDARGHIDDAGFTDNVMGRLPPARKPSRGLAPRFWPAIMTALASVVALFVLPGSDLFLDGFADLMVSDVTSRHSIAMLATIAIFACIGIASAIGER
jgi:hypothetical protein